MSIEDNITKEELREARLSGEISPDEFSRLACILTRRDPLKAYLNNFFKRHGFKDKEWFEAAKKTGY